MTILARMQKTAFVLLIALLTAGSLFADAAADVKKTETAFAQAFADRDAAKFFSFVADDAVFIGGRRTQQGKAQVIEVWSKYLATKTAPFKWHPETVVANASGTLAVSSGPVFDDSGAQTGSFSSVWQKQADGSWKVIFDGPGCPAPCPVAAK